MMRSVRSGSNRRFVRRILSGLVVVMVLAGCDELGLVEPLGSAEAPEERMAEFRVRVEFMRAEGNTADELGSLTIRMPGDDDAPTDADDWPYGDVYQFEGRIDHSNTESAYVKAFSEDENEAFTVRIRYWDIGTEPKTLTFDRTVESRASDLDGAGAQAVQTSSAVPR